MSTEPSKRALRIKSLSIYKAPAPSALNNDGPVFRVASFPGIDGLEGNLLIANRSHSSPLASFREQLDEVSRAAFGITIQDTLFVLPDEYHDERTPESRILAIEAQCRRHEDAFEASSMSTDEERVAHLLRFGLDFTRDGRVPLLCTPHLCRQAEAAGKGLCGAQMPSRVSISVSRFEDELKAARDTWLRSKRYEK